MQLTADEVWDEIAALLEEGDPGTARDPDRGLAGELDRDYAFHELQGTRLFAEVKIADQYGGEGQGDQLWYVLKVTYHDNTEQFFRMNGFYNSYDGGEYDGPFEEVKPRTVEKIEWRST